ncbi:MAG: hypothetical protein GAK45_02000 [Pseudomonas citronellolis]|nr:MAG: hypothetical protein GAK45_02000 [Pseudomonas citronellolis]
MKGRVADGDVVAVPGAVVQAAAHRAFLLAVFGTEVEKAGFTEGQPDIAAGAMGEAVAGGGLADIADHRAALVGRLEDDVDHPGDGVRTVLRRGAVAQHLDMVDGADRDGVEVDPGGALLQAAADIQVGGFMAALAVHQHQHVVGAEAAQRLRVGQRRGIERLGLAGQRGQQLDQRIAQVDRAAAAQLLGADHIDRAQALVGLDVGPAGAGDHHRGQRGADRRGATGTGRRGRAAQHEATGVAARIVQPAVAQGLLQGLLDAQRATNRRRLVAFHQTLVEGNRGMALADDGQQHPGQFAGRDIELLQGRTTVAAGLGGQRRGRRLQQAGQAQRGEAGDQGKAGMGHAGHDRGFLFLSSS